MYVQKRNGKREDVKFDKITSRINKLCYGLNPKFVDPVFLISNLMLQFANLALVPGIYLTKGHSGRLPWCDYF